MNIWLFISRECIPIIVCPRICFWWPKHFVSYDKSHLPLVTPSRQMKTNAVVFIRHCARQRYRDPPFYFIRYSGKKPYLSHQRLYTCSLWHRGFSAKDTNAFGGYLAIEISGHAYEYIRSIRGDRTVYMASYFHDFFNWALLTTSLSQQLLL